MSPWQYANDFFNALTSITSGLMLPLTTADLLAHAIVGLVLENLDMERLVREVGQAVAQRILGENQSVDDVARELHEKLLLRNESTKKLVIESIYKESAEAAHNVSIFQNAPTLADARPHLKRVSGSRFTDKYVQARAAARSGYAPAVPARSPPTSPRLSSSPTRKVVTEFKSFAAHNGSSVYGTAVTASPFSLAGNRAAFGKVRGGGGFGMDDDDEEEMEAAAAAAAGGTPDDGRQRVFLREDSITFEQVCPILYALFMSSNSCLLSGPANRDAERLERYTRLGLSTTSILGAHACALLCIYASCLTTAYPLLTISIVSEHPHFLNHLPVVTSHCRCCLVFSNRSGSEYYELTLTE